MFAQLVGGLLASSCNLEILAICPSVNEAIEAIDRHHPRLLILDLDLGGSSGLPVADHLLAVVPEARILVLSAQAGDFVCPDRLQQAVIAVVDKTQAWDGLVEQVAAYLRTVVDTTCEEVMPDRLAQLTARERQVLRHLGRGDASKAIAAALGVTVRTVETYRRNIACKLGVSGAELIRLAVLHTVADLPAPSAPVRPGLS